MRHIYEEEDENGYVYWEAYQDYPGEPWADTYICTIPTREDLDNLLDKWRADGVDFIIHELGGIDEHHVALPV